MFKKSFMVILGLITGVLLSAVTLSTAHAGTRVDGPFELAKVEDPASEKKCLEAFVNSNFDFAHPLCLSLAQLGMKDAQLVTGLMYAFGEGTKKNDELAKLWLKEAMRNGSAEAKEVLGEID